MSRRRKVRYSYPIALVTLAAELSRKNGKRAAARSLDLPLSTVYRWLAMPSPEASWEQTDACARGALLAKLIAGCEACGFNVRDGVLSLEPALPTAPLVARNIPDSSQKTDTRGTAHAANEKVFWGISARTRTRIRQAHTKIELQYYSNISCEELSRHAGISKWHFIRSFTDMFGVSPYRYLIQIRVRRAKELLRKSSQPLDTIATATGFDSLSSLCKAFKSIEGASLSSFFRGMRLGYDARQADEIAILVRRTGNLRQEVDINTRILVG